MPVRKAVREGPHAKERGRVSSRVRREGVGAAHQRSRERLPCPVRDVRAALLLCPSGRGPGRRQAAHDDGDARLVEAFLKGVGREVRPAAPRYVARKLLAVFLLGGTRLVVSVGFGDGDGDGDGDNDGDGNGDGDDKGGGDTGGDDANTTAKEPEPRIADVETWVAH